MKKLLGMVAIALGMASHALAVTRVTSIGFQVEGSKSEIVVDVDGAIEYTTGGSPGDRQFVLNLSNATLDAGAKRALNSTAFDSSVTLVNPVQVDANNVKIIVQLKEEVQGRVEKLDNQLRIAFNAPVESEVANDLPEFEAADMTKTGNKVSPETGKDEKLEAKSNARDDLDVFLENRETKNFKGSPITLKVKEAEVSDVLRLIADTSGFNIVVGSGVTGKVTLALESVPWDQALDVVLQTLNLGAERNNNVLRILTLDNLTKEKRSEIAAKEAIEQSSPKVTKIIPVSYADIASLKKLIESFGKGGQKNSNGTVDIDERTNQIIVQDIPENVERMQKLISILDAQTPQVLVEAKIVEATEGYNFDIGGSLGFGTSNGKLPFATTFAGANPLDKLVGTVATGDTFSQGSTGAGSMAISPSVAFLSGNLTLNALLKMGETESKVKVVSSPRTVVLNKQSAEILQSTPVLIKKKVQTDQGIFDTEEIAEAKISLTVTPTVTNDEGVLMKLNVARDVPAPVSDQNQAVAKRNIQTQVLVDSGTTLVIGGVYTMDKTSTASGFPVLRDIPVIGNLFGSRGNKTTRSELFIFITPRVLNVQKAGLAS